MQPEPMTPDQAIGITADLVSHVAFPVPEDFQLKMAAFMVVVTEILAGNCPCDPCTRTREMFSDL